MLVKMKVGRMIAYRVLNKSPLGHSRSKEKHHLPAVKDRVTLSVETYL